MCACEVNRESAEQVCDEKIVEWLANRKKHAAHKRKRTHRSARAPSPAPASWITKIKTPSKEGNTPKRSTNSLRRGRSAGPVDESNIFSPLAPSMTRAPTKPVKKQKQKTKTQSCLSFALADCLLFTYLIFSSFLAFCRWSALSEPSAYMCTHMHTYIRTHIHHTYIHTPSGGPFSAGHLPTYTHTYIHTYMHTCILPVVRFQRAIGLHTYMHSGWCECDYICQSGVTIFVRVVQQARDTRASATTLGV